jgi:hypothetical protein
MVVFFPDWRGLRLATVACFRSPNYIHYGNTNRRPELFLGRNGSIALMLRLEAAA